MKSLILSGSQASNLRLFILACSAFAVGGFSGSALGVVWIHIQEEFGLPLSALGLLVTVQMVGRLITSFMSGSLIGTFGMAWTLIAGLCVSAIGLFGFSIASLWSLLLLVGFLTGVGSGVLGTGLNAFAATNFTDSQMNWLHASFGVGATLGPIFVTLLVIDLGLAWQWSYVMFAAIQLVLVILFFVTRHEWRINSDQSEEQPHARIDETMRLPMVWLLVLIFIVATGTELTTGQLSNNLLVEGRGIDPKIAGMWISLYWGSLTVSRFLIGFVIERMSNGTFLRLNIIGTALGAALLWSNISSVTTFISLAIIGFTIAPFAPLMTSDTPRRMGTAHSTNAIGFQFTGGGLGMALSPWLAGWLAEHLGLEIIPPFLLCSALLTFVLHEMILYRDRKPVPALVRQ